MSIGKSFTAAFVLCFLGWSAAHAERYTIPLFVAPGASGDPQGVLRLVNDTAEAATVRVFAIADDGTRTGPATIALGASAAAQFDATELQSANAAKGLSGGLGSFSGDVRLSIDSDAPVVPLAFVRASDGALSAMHDTVRPASTEAGRYSYRVPIFNLSTAVAQASRLRLINPGATAASVTIAGRDDGGAAAVGGEVTLTLPAGGARTLTAQQLEAGGTGLTGQLGAGMGRWRLTVSSDRSLEVANVVVSSTGRWNNLSTTAVRGAAPADAAGFDDRFVGESVVLEVEGGRFALMFMENGRVSETVQTDGMFTTGEGGYDYVGLGPDAGRLTLDYDDGGQCRSNWYFSSSTGGWFASHCTGGMDAEETWSGGNWFVEDGDEDDGDDHGDTFDTATSISIPSTTPGELEEGKEDGDRDYFRVVVAAAGTLTVETTGRVDTYGTLFDGSRTQLATNDDGGSGTNFKIERQVPAGAYYVEVRGYRPTRTGSYELRVSAADDTPGGGGGGQAPTFGVDDALPGVPTSGVFAPSITGGGSSLQAGGVTTITLDNGSYFELNDGTRYTCTSSAGCTIENGTVTGGTIAGGAAGGGTGSDTRPGFAAGSGPGDRSYTVGTAIDALTLPEASGGDGALTYSLSPAVPGLIFNATASVRRLTGTPTASGAYNMTYRVRDTDGDTDSLSFTITVTDSASEPDLAVESVSVSDSSPSAGASFTLSATVRNRGDGQSGSTTLRYYRSTNTTISRSDTQVGTDSVSGLAASRTSAESVLLTAPSSAGTYYYGACVDSVAGESDTDNNCSAGVRITVQSAGGGGGTAARAGECVEGNDYTPGESCDVYLTDSSVKGLFAVFSDGAAGLGISNLNFVGGNDRVGRTIGSRGVILRGGTLNFEAVYKGGGVWNIDYYRP